MTSFLDSALCLLDDKSSFCHYVESARPLTMGCVFILIKDSSIISKIIIISLSVEQRNIALHEYKYISDHPFLRRLTKEQQLL